MNNIGDFDIDKELINEEILSEVFLKLPHKAVNKLLTFMKLVFDNSPEESVNSAVVISDMHLLSRIYNDLQSIYYLTKKGYSVQAATIACALYEAALTVIYIDDDESTGQRWLEHNKKKTTIDKVYEFKNKAVSNLSWSNETSNQLQNVYTYLSMAKHSNPLILSVHSFVQSSEKGYKDFNYGAEISENSFRLSYYSILISIQMGNAALCTFVNNIVQYINEDIFICRLQQLELEFTNILEEVINDATEKYGEFKNV